MTPGSFVACRTPFNELYLQLGGGRAQDAAAYVEHTWFADWIGSDKTGLEMKHPPGRRNFRNVLSVERCLAQLRHFAIFLRCRACGYLVRTPYVSPCLCIYSVHTRAGKDNRLPRDHAGAHLSLSMIRFACLCSTGWHRICRHIIGSTCWTGATHSYEVNPR